MEDGCECSKGMDLKTGIRQGTITKMLILKSDFYNLGIGVARGDAL